MTRLQLRTATQVPAGIATRTFDGDLPSLAPYVASRLVRALDTVLLWHERARQRRQLLELDEVMLRDIGAGRSAVMGEASKPFWRA